MTIPRLDALHRHWRKYPRVEWMVAAYLKYKPPSDIRDFNKPRGKPAKEQGNAADLAAMFGVKPGMSFTG